MIAGSLAVAVATALYWCWDHALAPAIAAGIVAAHVVAGLAIGALGSRWLRGRSGLARASAGAAAAFVALAVVPALASAVGGVSGRFVVFVATALPIAVLGAALVLAAARLGWLGPVLVGLGGIAALIATARAPAPILPAWPVVPVQRDPEAPLRRVAAIGFDGADWEVVDAMIDAGELRNLAALRARGSSAVLRSIEPIYSPVVWSSIFTGKTPEKHGIKGWYVSHAANRRAAMLWEILAGAGLRSVVVNVPGSWPASRFEGSLVSGFPIPSALRMPANAETQLLGHVVAESALPGLVPTVLARRDGEALVATLELPEPAREPRGRWMHFAIDRLVQRGTLHAKPRTLAVRIGASADGRRAIEIGAHRFELAPNAWSPWLREDAFGVPVQFRVRALGAGVYVTPFFQDPGAPVHPYASSEAVEAAVAERGMYVVEGIGWKIAEGVDVRDALFEHLVDVEDQHVGAALALAAETDWRLFVTVITITDRISHAFWPYRDPEGYGLDPSAVRPVDAGRVADAYRRADTELGRIVAALGDDVTYIVLSDHGFRSDPPVLRGNHRLEGIWVAAGPGIEPRAERGELGVLDVTPTILAGLGLPPAKDMDGVAKLGARAPARSVDSYEAGGRQVAAAREIDATTEEQLRSLGYVE